MSVKNTKPYKIYKHIYFDMVYCISDADMLPLYMCLNKEKGTWRNVIDFTKIDLKRMFTYIKDLTEAEVFVEIL